ncbi:MAG TPA: caspase family protein [Candidatus Obscuribacter sp.]|nr:caspase family protein [Candidatus Obscuribacter sp.]
MKAHMINLCRGAFYLTLALICCQLCISTGIAGESGQSSDTIKAGAGQSNARPIADKWAVLIGIDRFKDTRIPSLDYASKDAIDFGKFLVEKGHFAKDHVLVLTNENATRDKIRDAIGGTWLPSRAAKDDLVLIFASTHGSPKELDVGGENFLVAHDSDSRNLYVTGIRFSDLAPEVKERTGCDRVVLLLDACNSGAANVGGKGLIRTSNFDISSLAGEGQIVISSSAANQRSFESKRCTNGVFTRHLISALQKQGQNTTITEAFNYLKEQVENEVRFDRQLTQTPVMRSKWSGGELILVAVPTKPRQIEPATSAATDADSEVKPDRSAIPNLAGDWLASYGAHYQIWQNGREYGWKFPHEEGRGVIADDGKTARCRWWGKNNGTDTATLEYDSSGMVVRIVGSNGVTLTRQ